MKLNSLFYNFLNLNHEICYIKIIKYNILIKAIFSVFLLGLIYVDIFLKLICVDYIIFKNIRNDNFQGENNYVFIFTTWYIRVDLCITPFQISIRMILYNMYTIIIYKITSLTLNNYLTF